MGQGVVWVEVSVIRCSQGVFCGKRFASWQSPFREIPDDLSKEPEKYLLLSHPSLTVRGRARRAGDRVKVPR